MNKEIMELYFAQGERLKAAGKSDELIKYYNQAIDELNLNCAKIYLRLGQALAEKSQIDEAILSYRRSIKLNPKYSWAHIALANVLLSQEKIDEAIVEYRTGILLNSDFNWAYKFLINSLNKKALQQNSRLEKNILKKAKLNQTITPFPYSCIIFVACHSGLCNRLRALCSYLVVSMIFEVPLIMCWVPSQECEAQFDELYEELCPAIDSSDFIEIVDNFSSSVLYVTEDLDVLAIYEKYLEKILPYGDFEKKLIEQTQKMILKSDIQQSVDDFLQKNWKENTVGIHIRRTDHRSDFSSNSAISQKLSTDEGFFQRIEAELLDSSTNFFLATDNQITQELLIKRYPEKIISRCHTFDASKLRQTGVKDAVVDLYLLSKTRKIIGSYYSSFSTYASHLGNIPLDCA